jgi:hypothetical protein
LTIQLCSVCLQDLALKLRAEGRNYDAKVFKKKKDSKAGSGGGGGGGAAAAAGGKHKKAKVKIKSSQRDKAPYHVSGCARVWRCSHKAQVWFGMDRGAAPQLQLQLQLQLQQLLLLLFCCQSRGAATSSATNCVS